jgi:hypothetical protein
MVIDDIFPFLRPLHEFLFGVGGTQSLSTRMGEQRMS